MILSNGNFFVFFKGENKTNINQVVLNGLHQMYDNVTNSNITI
jgi:hypothetical protein